MSDTFLLSKKKRLLLFTCTGLFLLFPCGLFVSYALTNDNNVGMAAGIVTGIMLPFVAYLLFCIYYPRLVFTSKGVELRPISSFSLMLFAWDEIESAEIVSGKEALILKKPSSHPVLKRLANWAGVSFGDIPMYSPQQLSLIAERRYLPIDGFEFGKEYSNLNESLSKFAPALCGPFQSSIQKAAEASSQDKRLIWIVSILTGGVIVCSIVFAIWPLPLSDETYAWLKTAILGAESILGYIVAVAMALYAAANFHATLSFVKAGRYGMASFWGLFAIMQSLLVILLFSAL